MKDHSQQVKRDGIRTRNQANDSSNSPLPKNQSLSSQNRRRRYHAKDDDENDKMTLKKDQNLNEMMDEILVSGRNRNAVKGIGGRSGSRRIQK